MKNIKKLLLRYFVSILILSCLFNSLKANGFSHCGLRSGFAAILSKSTAPHTIHTIINFSPPYVHCERDTFPFLNFRKKQTIKLPSSSTIFPESKSYLIPYHCNVLFDGKDPGTGERKKELAPEHLLSYTSPHLKPYLPGQDLLEAETRMIKFSGGYIYLTIKFRWNAKNPNSAYGRLKVKGAVRCYLTNGKSVTLYNTKESIWQKNEDQTSHSLQALFMLHPNQTKLLKKYSIMHLTVYWEKGFEDYPIYPIKIFMNQLSCLEN